MWNTCKKGKKIFLTIIIIVIVITITITKPTKIAVLNALKNLTAIY